jgi:hypothetical protein
MRWWRKMMGEYGVTAMASGQLQQIIQNFFQGT